MIGGEIYVIAALCDAIAPRRPAAPMTPEQQSAAAIREIKMSMATFALQGALLSPSSEGSIKCFEQYMKLQTEMLVDELKDSLRECLPSEHSTPL